MRKARISTLSLAMLALAVGLLPGCDRLRNYSEQELIQRAKDFQDKGDFKAAIIELKNALQKNPDNPETRWLLGQVYVETGYGSGAEKELVKAGQLGINPESLKVPLGRALLQEHYFSRVLREIQPGAQTSQQNLARILQIRGDAYYGLGKIEESCVAYTDSREKDQAYVPAYWGLTKCALAKGDANQAKTWLAAAYKLEPKNAGTWLLQGDMERSQKQLKEAEASYGQALKLQPDNATALTSRALISISLGHYDSAQKDISRLREEQPRLLMARYLQGLLDYNQGNYKKAREELLEVLRVEQNHVPTLLLAGSVAYALGNYQEAETRLNGVLARLPREASVRKLLAAAQLRLNLVGKAIETLNPLLGTAQQDVQTLMLAGDAYMRAKDYNQATAFFERAVALEPNRAELKTALGRSKLATGEMDAAIGQLQAATTLDPKNPQADVLLTLTYLGKKDYDKALATIASLEKKLPDNPLVSNLKGQSLLGKQDNAGARKSFERALSQDAAFVPAAISLAELDMRDKNFPAAKKRFEGVLAKDENNLQAMLFLARIGELGGAALESRDWLERALKANPARIEPRLELASYYLKRGEAGKAVVLTREAKDIAPDHPLVLDAVAAAQAANGEFNNAIATYNRLIELRPNAAMAYFKLGSVQLGAGKQAESRASLAKALSLKPDFLEAKLELANLEIKAGRYDQALAIAKDIQQKSPHSSLGYSLEGNVWMERKNYLQAAALYETANKRIATSGGIIKQHLALSKAGKTTDADNLALGWIKSNPADVVVRLYMGEAYMLRDKAELAVEQYRSALQKDPENLSALNNLAAILSKQDSSAALQYAEKAYQLRPDSAPIADTLGWIRTERGDVRQGLDLLQKAARLDPGALQIRYHLAVALAKSGNKTQARTELEQLLRSKAAFKDRAQAQELLRQL